MGYPTFLSDGYLTPDGQMLVEWIEAQFAAIDQPGEKANLPAINSLSGPLAEYYSIVYKTHAKTPEGWVQGFGQSVRNAYDLMQYVEAEAKKQADQAQQVQENASKNSELEAKFDKLQESVAAQVADLEAKNVALQTELDALKAQPKGKGKDKAADKAKADAEETPSEGE